MGSEKRFRPRVVIAGGGVAALETLLALRELVGHRVRLELIAPGDAMVNGPHRSRARSASAARRRCR